MADDQEHLHRNAEKFPTTRLGLVFAAALQDRSHESREAMEALCRIYWYPLYAFIRRQGNSVEEAQDLTQAFIVHLLEKNTLRKFHQQRGRFRSFLLTCLKNFLNNERDAAGAIKRGGGSIAIPIDVAMHTAEDRYRMEPQDALTPEKIFEKRWALEVLDQAIAQLRDEFLQTKRAEQFEQLRPYVTGDESSIPYSQLAGRLGMTEGALKVAIHRLRQRFHATLRDLISLTVIHPTEISDEIRYLIDAIRS